MDNFVLKLVIPGKAVGMALKIGRGGHRYYSAKTITYWNKIAFYAKLQLKQPTKEDVVIVLTCYFLDKNYPDLDNISRIYLNAFKKILYTDDAQVADLHIKRIINKKERERTEVEIYGV